MDVEHVAKGTSACTLKLDADIPKNKRMSATLATLHLHWIHYIGLLHWIPCFVSALVDRAVIVCIPSPLSSGHGSDHCNIRREDGLLSPAVSMGTGRRGVPTGGEEPGPLGA